MEVGKRSDEMRRKAEIEQWWEERGQKGDNFWEKTPAALVFSARFRYAVCLKRGRCYRLRWGVWGDGGVGHSALSPPTGSSQYQVGLRVNTLKNKGKRT